MKQSHILLSVLFFGALALGTLYVLSKNTTSSESTNPQVNVVAPPTGPIVVTGTITCLPHKDTSGPQTMECAFGFRDTEGRYYGLKDTDPEYKNIPTASMETPVEVTGTFIPQEDTRYQSIGVIELTKISSVSPQESERVSITGEYGCLPKAEGNTVSTLECMLGLLTPQGNYVLDLNLLSQNAPEFIEGDTLTATGIVTPKEELSTDQWMGYDIVGIFSVTDSLSVN